MRELKSGKLKSKLHFLLLAPFLVVLLMQFNNCSKYKQPEISSSSEESNNSSSSSTGLTKTGDLCEDTIRELFSDGYYQFVQTVQVVMLLIPTNLNSQTPM